MQEGETWKKQKVIIRSKDIERRAITMQKNNQKDRYKEAKRQKDRYKEAKRQEDRKIDRWK